MQFKFNYLCINHLGKKPTKLPCQQRISFTCIQRIKGREASTSWEKFTILDDKYFLEWRENILKQNRLKLRSTYFPACNTLFWFMFMSLVIRFTHKCADSGKQRRMIGWVNVSRHILSQSEMKQNLIIKICSLTVSRAQRLLHVFLLLNFICLHLQSTLAQNLNFSPLTSIRFALHQSLGLASAL